MRRQGLCECAVAVAVAVFGMFANTPPATGQEMKPTVKTSAGAEILASLGALRGEMQALEAELSGRSGLSLPDRHRVHYEEYLRAFSKLRDRIESFRQRLSEHYQEVDRLYRVSPSGQEYKRVRQAYAENKTLFDGIDACFATIEAPEKVRRESVTSRDGRLNLKVATASRNSSGKASEPAAELERSDRALFIGSFDSVEMFLMVRGGSACYVFFGWRETAAQENGRSVERMHVSVARSEFFPVESAEHGSPTDHLERALHLKVIPLEAQGADLQSMNEYLSRIKSYAK
jgi:hypothetical protein